MAVDPSSLDRQKIAEAWALAAPACGLCARDCQAPRGEFDEDGSGGAWCRAPLLPRISSEMIHVGEEACLVPSHAIFFSGCLARCSFCQAWRSSQDPGFGVRVTSAQLAALIDQRRSEGARNVNFVGGDATIYLPYVLETLAGLQAPQQVVWNTAMYHGPRTAALLDGIVDVYLGDWKFGNDACARQIGAFVRYGETMRASYAHAAGSGADVIVRHLVMPGHVECCTAPVLADITRYAPGAKLSLMLHYLPSWKAEHDTLLGRMATRDELGRAEELAAHSGLERIR